MIFAIPQISHVGPRRFGLVWLLLTMGLVGTPASARPQQFTPPPGDYLTPDRMDAELLELEKTYGRLELSRLGQSPEGRTIWLCTFRSPQYAANKPEALVVANLEGDRLASTEVAMGLIRRMATRSSIWAQSGTLHIMPCVNPDGWAQAVKGLPPTRGAAIDEDRDGRADEDGPADINGDGRVLWVRIPTAAGEWYQQPSDPRAMARVENGGETGGGFRLMREGWDQDGDRRIMEDGPGGIAVDRNFPHRWQQYAASAGPYPLSEMESSTLARFVISRPKLAWTLVLDDEDNLAQPPKGQEKVDPSSTEPLLGDAAFAKTWSERLYRRKMATGKTLTKPKGAAHQPGTFSDWAYYQRGLYVLESAVWTLPTGDAKKGMPMERKKLAWADEHYGQRAFVPWSPFQHPELGDIEIGGWLPLVDHNPPAEQMTDITLVYEEFLMQLAKDFAVLEWADVQVQPLDDRGVVEVRAKLANVGLLPTISEMAEKNRAKAGIQVRVDLPRDAEVLVGKEVTFIPRLAGGGDHVELRWILRVPLGGGRPTLQATCPTASPASIPLEF